MDRALKYLRCLIAGMALIFGPLLPIRAQILQQILEPAPASGGAGFSYVDSCYAIPVAQALTQTITVGSTGLHCNTGTNVAVGDVLVVGISAAGGLGTLSCTDTLSDSWTTGQSNNEPYCYSIAGFAGAATITLHFTATQWGIIKFLDMGHPSGAAFDVNGGGSNASSTTWTSASLTTTAASDVIIFTGGTSATYATTFSGSGGSTIPTDGQAANPAIGASGFIAYQIEGSAGAYTVSAGLTTAEAGYSGVIAFKP